MQTQNGTKTSGGFTLEAERLDATVLVEMTSHTGNSICTTFTIREMEDFISAAEAAINEIHGLKE